MLKLMYITNNPSIAQIAENTGVDRIFIDMEFIGKSERQNGLDSVQNHHTLEDIKIVKNAINKAEIVVRVNPIHGAVAGYISSEEEIDGAIKNGANIIMLPYFKAIAEVEQFINIVNGRAKTMLLLETIEGVSIIDDILKIKGIDEIHIGLNDLSICLNEKFMFQPLADGVIDSIVGRIKKSDIPYGFGGIARLGYGEIPSENIIIEHYRLGSSMAILSRSFCNANKVSNIGEIEDVFNTEVVKIRELEKKASLYTKEQFDKNRQETIEKINKVVEILK